MATSSITKTFVIKDTQTIERFERQMAKESPIKRTKGASKLEEGKKLLRRFSSQ